MTNKRTSTSEEKGGKNEPRFQTRARALRLRPNIDPTRLGKLEAELETAAFRNLTRQLQNKKTRPTS